MKKILFCLLLVALLLPLAANKNPRVFLQKLVLDNGNDPKITILEDKSAPEYRLQAWIKERPKEKMDTNKQITNFLAVKRIGNGVQVPYTVVAFLNLGNFPSEWTKGETLHLKLTHKKSKAVVEWNVVIPEGGNVINMLDKPQVIPPVSTAKP
jgi:hypothetical protein